ncbi:hypothetical protein ACJX0J_039027, partial [Zea mays]
MPSEIPWQSYGWAHIIGSRQCDPVILELVTHSDKPTSYEQDAAVWSTPNMAVAPSVLLVFAFAAAID